MFPRKLHLGALAAAAVLVPIGVLAQKPDSGAFIVRLGTDTLAVERYVRTPHQLIADALLRTPQTRALRLTVNFRDDGTVANYEVFNRPVPGVPNSAPILRTLVTYVGDSARIQVTSGETVRPARTVLTRGGILPVQQPFYSTYESALAASRKTGTDTQTVVMLVGSGPLPYQVRWFNDSVTLSNPTTGTLLARVDKHGRMLMLSGQNTTYKVMVTRTRSLDMDAYARRFAAADAQGRSVGILSPRDTTIATIGAARLLVDYGRPSKRGRIVFGGIVPWKQVWRTGANAATQIEFSAPVEINGVFIPEGKYTLWSIPDPQRWQIVINKQTGQWGTDYDEKQDLARIPVKVERLSVPVETFSIGVREKNGSSAVMTMSWDRMRVVVPIVVKPASARTSSRGIKKRMAPSLPQRT